MTTTTGKQYGYARVSTIQQDLASQIEALIKAGVPAENIFSEKMSGKNTNRPEWRKLEGSEKLREGEPMNGILQSGDTLFVHKLDRLGRSVSDVTRIVDKFQENGIYLVVLDSGIDTRKQGNGMEGMMTKALITLLSLMAEMERTFIMERTRPAIEAAKASGVKFGRPKASKQVYEMAVKEYLEGGITSKELIAKYGKDSSGKDIITEPTLFRRIREYRKKLEEQNTTH